METIGEAVFLIAEVVPIAEEFLMFVKDVVALGEVFPVVGAVLDFIVISAMIIIGATAVIVGDILVVIADVAVVAGAEVVDFLKL